MKVLFVLNSGLHSAGPSQHLFDGLIGKLISDGWKVHVIEKQQKGRQADPDSSYSEGDNPVRFICNTRHVEKGSLIKRYIADIYYVLLCLKHYRENKNADVVFLQSCNTSVFHLLAIKLLVRKSVVYNVQDIFPLNAAMAGLISENSISYKVLGFLQRHAYRQADKIITISEDMKKTLMEEGVTGEKIQVIHNWGYSDEIIEINQEDNQFIIDKDINRNCYKVVYAGNIGAVQNVEIILKAARILNDSDGIQFYIIGDGVRKKELMKFVEAESLENVAFYPMQPPKYAPHIYSMADINIIPLVKGIIKTALPSKTAICLSCGKPIIACIDPGSGFSQMLEACDKCCVVDSNDAEGLAACILQFKQNVKGRSVGERELFQRTFLKETNVSGYAETIKGMVKNGYANRKDVRRNGRCLREKHY